MDRGAGVFVRRGLRWTAAAAMGLATVLTSHGAAGQQVNYNTVIVGGRPTAVAGAATAVADDSSATLHNPAGIASRHQQGVSLSVSAYGVEHIGVDEFVREDGETVAVDRTTVTAFPTATAYVLPLGGGAVQHTAALSVLVPAFFEFEDTQAIGASDDTVFDSVAEQTLLIGPSYGLRAGAFQLGASVFFQYYTLNMKSSASIQDTVDDADGTGTDFVFNTFDFLHLDGDELGVVADVGLLYHLGRHVSVGVNVMTPSLRLGGGGRAQFSESMLDVGLDPAGDPSSIEGYQDQYDVGGALNSRRPWAVSLGGAYRDPERFLVAVDVDLALPVDAFELFEPDAQPAVPDTVPASAAGSLQEWRGFIPSFEDPGRRMVLNAAVGTDVVIADGLSLLGGLHTDFASVAEEDVEVTTRGFLLAIDSYGAALGVTTRSSGSNLTVAVRGTYGVGKALGADYDSDGPVERLVQAQRWALGVTIAGSAAIFDEAEDGDVADR